jgi:prepilin-type processing-associated H-X9-DG protein
MSRLRRILWVALALTSLFLCILAIPQLDQTRDTPGWKTCQFELRCLALAMIRYHPDGKIPPAAIRDETGRPLLSWRVAILRQVEEPGLYEEFKLDEPWDSPHNLPLLKKMPRIFGSASLLSDAASEGKTHYRVFTGPGTAFETPGLQPATFLDGPEQTILVVEAAGAVPWTKPDELPYDPQQPLPPLGVGFSRDLKLLGYSVGRRRGFNVAFADGSARFVRQDVDEATLRALITRNGGEKIDSRGLE